MGEVNLDHRARVVALILLQIIVLRIIVPQQYLSEGDRHMHRLEVVDSV